MMNKKSNELQDLNKSDIPYATLRIPLQTSEVQNHQLRNFFSNYYAYYLEVRNLLKTQLYCLKSNRKYQQYMKKLRRWRQAGYNPNKEEKKFVNNKLRELTEAYHLDGRFKAITFVNGILKQKYKHLNAQMRNAIVDDIYVGIGQILYSNGQKLGFMRFNNFTISTQTTESPFRLTNRNLVLQRLSNRKKSDNPHRNIPSNTIQYKTAPFNEYQQEVLNNRELKFFRLVQVQKKNHVDYMLQIVYKGVPPTKGRKPGNGQPIGLDIGPSSIATYRNDKVELKPIFHKYDVLTNQIVEIQRKMSILDELNNPDAFFIHPNGKHSYIKGYRLMHTNHWYRLRQNLRYLYTFRTRIRNQRYNIIANDLISESGQIKYEKVSVAGWQSGLFGTSINNHAPGLLMEKIAQKLKYFDKEPLVIKTAKAKLSQYHHDTNEFTKVDLNERTKIIDGFEVQRDIYSAFLAAHVEEDGFTVGQINDFEQFKEFQNGWVKNFVQSGDTELSSFGISPKMKEQARI